MATNILDDICLVVDRKTGEILHNARVNELEKLAKHVDPKKHITIYSRKDVRKLDLSTISKAYAVLNGRTKHKFKTIEEARSTLASYLFPNNNSSRSIHYMVKSKFIEDGQYMGEEEEVATPDGSEEQEEEGNEEEGSEEGNDSKGEADMQKFEGKSVSKKKSTAKKTTAKKKASAVKAAPAKKQIKSTKTQNIATKKAAMAKKTPAKPAAKTTAKKSSASTGGGGGATSEARTAKLMSLMKRKTGVTVVEAAESIGCSKRTVRNILAALVDDGHDIAVDKGNYKL